MHNRNDNLISGDKGIVVLVCVPELRSNAKTSLGLPDLQFLGQTEPRYTKHSMYAIRFVCALLFLRIWFRFPTEFHVNVFTETHVSHP